MANGVFKDSGVVDDSIGAGLAIWSEQPLAPWLSRAVQESKLELCSIGSQQLEVRHSLGQCDRGLTDFRSLSAFSKGIPLLFVGFGSPASRALISRNHPLLFTTEPWFGHNPLQGSGAYEILLPGSPVDGRFNHATEIFEQSGAPAIAQVTSLGAVEHGSILSRIHDAAHFLLRWMGTPDRVSAAIGGDRRHRTRDDQPDAASRSFRTWVGSFAITCHYSDGRAGLIMASNQHPNWHRSALACGAFGAVRVDDTSLEWRDPSNAVVDRGSPHLSEWDEGGHPSIAAATLRQGSATSRSLVPDQGLICRAFVEAACLSAYTLESESPSKMVDILARG